MLNSYIFFRITAVCGDYYIGGRQFDSLTELVGFYSHCSDLLKRERLVEPIPPPEPVNDKKVSEATVSNIILLYLNVFFY